MRGDHLSFSLFVDFLLAHGGARVSVVRSHHRPPFDAYEGLKLGIVRVLSGEAPFSLLEGYVAQYAADPRRSAVLADRLASLRLFMKKNKLVDQEACRAAWLPVPATVLPLALGMGIFVNPEVCLSLKGVPHVLKLFLRSGEEKLARGRVELVAGIMAGALRAEAPPGALFGMLDLTDPEGGAVHVVRDPKKLERAATSARADGLSYVVLYRDRAAA
jgi:hypothetical protein